MPVPVTWNGNLARYSTTGKVGSPVSSLKAPFKLWSTPAPDTATSDPTPNLCQAPLSYWLKYFKNFLSFKVGAHLKAYELANYNTMGNPFFLLFI